MKNEYRFIFDIDGTLYKFDKGKGASFAESAFYADLRKNVYGFFVRRLGLTLEKAVIEYERIKERYQGEVSLGIEAEYGIDRYDYFNSTWDLNPNLYIEKDTDLPEMLDQLKGRVALLTAAPGIWAVNVLAHLNIQDVFGEALYSGEPDLRKPNPLAFQKIADDFGVSPDKVVSIGDQENSDIIPAKSIGMKTVFVGSGATSADYKTEDVKSAIILLRKEGFI